MGTDGTVYTDVPLLPQHSYSSMVVRAQGMIGAENNI